MRTIINILALVCLIVAIPCVGAPKPSEGIRVISTKRYLFDFKAAKTLMGATVEVRDDQQNIVLTDKVREVRTIIDFFALRPGNYTIDICKDDREFLFLYLNQE